MIASTLSIKSYAALKGNTPLTPYSFETPPLKPHEVLVKVTHCGLCHSDLHLLSEDWDTPSFPFIPGHEVIGHVVEKGELALSLSTQDRVGIGWQSFSCGQCEWCHCGEENLCDKQIPTCVGRPGGFASHIVIDHRFAFPIPKELDSMHAAPLLCAGATVFSPFIQHGVQGTWRVGIYGMGGLGHLAIAFAKAFGCEVSVFSSSASKKEEALKRGATHFFPSNELDGAKGSLDLLLFTSSGDADFQKLTTLLRPKGKLCILGAPGKACISLHPFSLIEGRKTVCGSNIASPSVIRTMLDFAAKHKVLPEVECFPMKEVNHALDKMKKGALHYRAVLTADE